MSRFARAFCACLRRLGKIHGTERIANLISPQSLFPEEFSVTLKLHGQQMRVWPRSRVGWNLYVFGNYDPQLRRIMRGCITPGSTIVDAGANIGWHTVFAAKLTKSSGIVHAFEPNPSVMTELMDNLVLNGISNVRTWGVALSDQVGVGRFVAPDVSSHRAGDGRLCAPEGYATECDTLEVKLATLDSLDLGSNKVTFIKIDVEGHELPLLRGAIGTIKNHRPVIAFEHFSESFADTRTDAIMQLLADLDYQFFGYDDRRPPYHLHSLISYSGDVLAVSRRTQFNPLEF